MGGKKSLLMLVDECVVLTCFASCRSSVTCLDNVKNLNYHNWRKQDISKQTPIQTTPMHKYICTENSIMKTSTEE